MHEIEQQGSTRPLGKEPPGRGRLGANEMTADPYVLVVDDHREMRELIADVLGSVGLDALVVEGGLEALRVISAESEQSGNPPLYPIDLVITDLRMPVLDGLDLLAAIRRLHPGVRVVLMSAFATDDVRCEAERLGAESVLAKPFSDAELLETVFTQVRHRRVG